jgi:uncharacterized protein YdhG (YjbR/CyaY superfamily)
MNAYAVAEDVDAYIAAAPKETRDKLSQLSSIFREVAPQADEAISYHMPYYRSHGMLGGFAAFKDHVTLFGAVAEGSYKTGRRSVQFQLDKPLPVGLVAKLVRTHIKMKEGRAGLR